MREYFLHREALTNVFVLIDSRIPPQRIDLEFINFLGENGIPLSLVFTKADKESQREVQANMKAMKKDLLEMWEELPPIFLTSSLTGMGREAVLDSIESINQTLK